tara:strand:+ start:890 stop:1051 length:162 start_codon:yes stop_codon:yes gene_type:complete
MTEQEFFESYGCTWEQYESQVTEIQNRWELNEATDEELTAVYSKCPHMKKPYL